MICLSNTGAPGGLYNKVASHLVNWRNAKVREIYLFRLQEANTICGSSQVLHKLSFPILCHLVRRHFPQPRYSTSTTSPAPFSRCCRPGNGIICAGIQPNLRIEPGFPDLLLTTQFQDQSLHPPFHQCSGAMRALVSTSVNAKLSCTCWLSSARMSCLKTPVGAWTVMIVFVLPLTGPLEGAILPL